MLTQSLYRPFISHFSTGLPNFTLMEQLTVAEVQASLLWTLIALIFAKQLAVPGHTQIVSQDRVCSIAFKLNSSIFLPTDVLLPRQKLQRQHIWFPPKGC